MKELVSTITGGRHDSQLIYAREGVSCGRAFA